MFAVFFLSFFCIFFFFFFQAEDGIRDLVRSRGLGDVYKRQVEANAVAPAANGGLPDRILEEAGVLAADGTRLMLSLIHI